MQFQPPAQVLQQTGAPHGGSCCNPQRGSRLPSVALAEEDLRKPVKEISMPTRRKFIATALPLAATGALSAAEPAEKPLPVNGVESAATKEDLKKSVLFAHSWHEASFAERHFLFALSVWPTDGESYIDLHGWIYNKSFKEWRRICLVKTRNLGNAKLSIDEKTGVVVLSGAANNELKGQVVFRFDLRATSDDAGYVR
jgi:hypothetical protein